MMNSKTPVRNALIGVDVSGDERRAFLQKLQRSPQFSGNVRNHTRAASLIGTDVSQSDPRSVKAQLAGKGAWRAQWWQFNCLVCQVMNPRMSLEETMFAFHRRHHAITLAWLKFVAENKQIFATLRECGIGPGLRRLIAREFARSPGDQV